MSWIQLIPLIATYGIPIVEKLWALAQTNTAPSQADWDALKALTTQTAKQQMALALARNGIDPLSPQGVALLALAA